MKHELSVRQVASMGGKARRDKLTPQQRTESARKARAAQTPEAISAAVRKGWETRRKNLQKNKS